jgi:hypothetical protein
MILYALVSEQPHSVSLKFFLGDFYHKLWVQKVMAQFELQVGQLQRLQQNATFFAAMVTKFCGLLPFFIRNNSSL